MNIVREWSKEENGVGIVRGFGWRGGKSGYCEGVGWRQGGNGYCEGHWVERRREFTFRWAWGGEEERVDIVGGMVWRGR